MMQKILILLVGFVLAQTPIDELEFTKAHEIHLDAILTGVDWSPNGSQKFFISGNQIPEKSSTHGRPLPAFTPRLHGVLTVQKLLSVILKVVSSFMM